MDTLPSFNLKVSVEQQTKQFFETKPIEDIRRLEYKTRSEIEEKKRELHQLIGNRYRDIIDSADSILDMKRDAEGLKEKLRSISTTCLNLRQVVTKAELNAKNSERQLKRKLYFLAKQIKLLVDTPEEIWYSLETHDYIKATVQYLVAKKLHEKLYKDTDVHSVKILRSISLVNRQWERIERFPKKILEACQHRLESHGLKPKEYGGPLVAYVFLSNRKPLQVFMDFLAARKKSLMNILTQVDHEDLDKVNVAICRFTRVLQYTLYHIGTLFLCYPFLEKKLEDGIEDGEFNAGEKTAEEMGLLYILLSKVMKQLNEDDEKGQEFVQIREETIQNLTSEWMTSCAELVSTCEILCRINSVKQFTYLEQLIAKQSKYPFVDVINMNEQNSDTSRLPSWSETCLHVINKHFDIFETIFRIPFLHHVKRVITTSFSNLSLLSTLQQTLDQISTPTSSATMLYPTSGTNFSNSGFDFSEENVGEYVWTNLDHVAHSDVQRRKQMSQGVTHSAHRLAVDLDNQLGVIMDDIETILALPGSTVGGLAVSGESRELSSSKSAEKSVIVSAVKKQDIKDLRKFVQDTCFQAIVDLIQKLEELIDRKITEFYKNFPDNQDSRSPEVLRILYIGRLCTLLSTYSKKIRYILVDLDPTSADFFGRNVLSLKTRQILEKISSPYKEIEAEVNSHGYEGRLSQCVRRPQLKAYLCWARALIGVNPLMAKFHDGLRNPDWRDPSRKKSWMIIKMQSSVRNSHSDHEEYVPAQPSAYLIEFLYQLCNEMQQIGGHILDDAIVTYILQEVSSQVLDAFSSYLREAEESILKESMLQFWFDVKFFLDIVQGRTVTNPALQEILGEKERDSDDLSHILEWTKKVEDLMKNIKSKLDPIDVRFYEKPIINQTTEYYKCSYLLFGQITKNNPRITERHTISSSTSVNVMTLLPPVGRFKLLPILEPTESQGDQQIDLGVDYAVQGGKQNSDVSASNTGLGLRIMWGTFGLWSDKVPEENNNKKSSWFG